MTTFPGSPRVLKGGIVVIDPESSAVRKIIALQYNPDTLTRTLQPQSAGGETGDRSDALRLKGPPIETLKLEIVVDATDQLEFPEHNPTVTEAGISPQLAALETLVYPASEDLLSNNQLSRAGTLEIAPIQAPLTLFVWSRNRMVPVRITEFSITEEAFDPLLNPIRAKINLGMRILSVSDLGFDSKGGSLYLSYQRQKERLAAMSQSGLFSALGIGGIP